MKNLLITGIFLFFVSNAVFAGADTRYYNENIKRMTPDQYFNGTDKKTFKITKIYSDKYFIIGQKIYEPKKYCPGWQVGDEVSFDTTTVNCVSTLIKNKTKHNECRAWCDGNYKAKYFEK